MSKGKPSTQDEKQDENSSPIPSRTVGLSIMCLMIVFVATWMTLQARQQDMGSSSVPTEPSILGFASDAWYLPDDPLLGFTLIPVGPFVMGSNPALDRLAYENERWSNTRRQGSVEVGDFYIGRFEVTAAQFRLFAQQNPNLTSSVSVSAAGNFPVTNIAWPEALAYARWLQQQLEDSDDTPAALRDFIADGGRVTLPTEAEWEKAARGGDARIFPWGNTPSTNFANYSTSTLLPVGSKPCPDCAYGLQDMSGNAWEFTRSPLQPYPYSLEDDDENLAEDALWVMRGGSYADVVGNIRAAVRGGVDPSVRSNSIGFRLVISKP